MRRDFHEYESRFLENTEWSSPTSRPCASTAMAEFGPAEFGPAEFGPDRVWPKTELGTFLQGTKWTFLFPFHRGTNREALKPKTLQSTPLKTHKSGPIHYALLCEYWVVWTFAIAPVMCDFCGCSVSRRCRYLIFGLQKQIALPQQRSASLHPNHPVAARPKGFTASFSNSL